jgi:hypothetical protein
VKEATKRWIAEAGFIAEKIRASAAEIERLEKTLRSMRAANMRRGVELARHISKGARS